MNGEKLISYFTTKTNGYLPKSLCPSHTNKYLATKFPIESIIKTFKELNGRKNLKPGLLRIMSNSFNPLIMTVLSNDPTSVENKWLSNVLQESTTVEAFFDAQSLKRRETEQTFISLIRRNEIPISCLCWTHLFGNLLNKEERSIATASQFSNSEIANFLTRLSVQDYYLDFSFFVSRNNLYSFFSIPIVCFNFIRKNEVQAIVSLFPQASQRHSFLKLVSNHLDKLLHSDLYPNGASKVTLHSDIFLFGKVLTSVLKSWSMHADLHRYPALLVITILPTVKWSIGLVMKVEQEGNANYDIEDVRSSYWDRALSIADNLLLSEDLAKIDLGMLASVVERTSLQDTVESSILDKTTNRVALDDKEWASIIADSLKSRTRLKEITILYLNEQKYSPPPTTSKSFAGLGFFDNSIRIQDSSRYFNIGFRVELIDTEEKLQSLLHNVDNIGVAGLDCEWATSDLAITQLSLEPIGGGETVNYIFDMLEISKNSRMNEVMTELFLKLYEEEVTWIGFSCHQDFTKISAILPRLPDCPATLIDLGKIKFDDEKKRSSLNQMSIHFLGRELDKRPRMSFWEARPLRRSQILYAAGDTEVMMCIYSKLRKSFQHLL